MKAKWRGEIFYIVTLLMESCWLGALLLFLNELVADGNQLSIIWLWLMYPAAFLINRLLCRSGWRRYRCYAIAGLVWALGTLLMLKAQLYAGYSLLDSSWLFALSGNMSHVFQAFQPEVLTIIGCGVLFWRGWYLAWHGVTFASIGTSFQFGLSILLIILFLSHLISVSFSDSVLLVIAFSFLALVGMGLCRSTDVAAEQAGVSIQRPKLLLAAVGLILLLGLLIGSFVTSDLLQLLLDAIRWLWGIILQVIAFLLSLLPESGPAEPPPTTPMPELPPSGAFHPWVLPEPIRGILANLVIFGFIALTAVALYRMFSDIWHRLRGVSSRGATIEHLPIMFRANFLGALMRLIYRILGVLFPWRLARRQERMVESQSREVSSIRHIYQSLLLWGAKAGYPKRVNETPYEYLETLGSTLSMDGRGKLSYITEVYITARYGQNWEGSEPLQRVRESWERIRQLKIKKAPEEHTLHNDTP